MLNCKHLVENSSEYLEGDMTRWQRAKTKFHLMMCRSCNRYVKQLQHTITMLRKLGKTEPSEELQSKLNEHYTQEMSNK